MHLVRLGGGHQELKISKTLSTQVKYKGHWYKSEKMFVWSSLNRYEIVWFYDPSNLKEFSVLLLETSETTSPSQSAAFWEPRATVMISLLYYLFIFLICISDLCSGVFVFWDDLSISISGFQRAARHCLDSAIFKSVPRRWRSPRYVESKKGWNYAIISESWAWSRMAEPRLLDTG